ncbi:alkaline phosphatase D family protein [Spongisporangium articulatum]|uniref:Alkaline phosphatase D family protein n=1 Tax=Spongisporangium articulatum TaxID=3362603 RepID=A0ABW8AMI6_9ACTN
MKIAAASCAKLSEDAEQLAWAEIQAAEPDVLLLGGDNVYLANDALATPAALTAGLRAQYKKQFAVPTFKALLADLKRRGGEVVPIYDDHDFLGDNRCGRDDRNKRGGAASLRRAARDEFVRQFAKFGVKAPDSGGVYRVLRRGLVDIFVVDGRYHRHSLNAEEAARPVAFLSRPQWDWLERELAQPTSARYTVLLSGTTVHNFAADPEVEDRNVESWERYTAAYERLLGLLGDRPGTVVVSGDIHVNRLTGARGLLEVVTSGVARKTVHAPKRPLRNWALLTFDQAGMTIEQHSLSKTLAPKNATRTVRFDDWQLPPLDAVSIRPPVHPPAPKR